jgi:hypothetical protein
MMNMTNPAPMQRVSRNPQWREVKAYCEDRIERGMRELLTCEIVMVERVRGRIQALQALLDIARRDEQESE